jgi:hypothetical protein
MQGKAGQFLSRKDGGRGERLAKALRENLKRRKAQARKREDRLSDASERNTKPV